MWNSKPSYTPTNQAASDRVRPEPSAETPRPAESSMAARVSSLPQQNAAVIGKTITIHGDITGSEPLHIEGTVKGAVRLEGAYLNIGPDANVQAVVAREVVVRGSVNGNVNVSERVDIRSGGSVVGDLTAHSVSIEEGAYFKGSIDMRRPESRQKTQSTLSSSSPKPIEPERARAATA